MLEAPHLVIFDGQCSPISINQQIYLETSVRDEISTMPTHMYRDDDTIHFVRVRALYRYISQHETALSRYFSAPEYDHFGKYFAIFDLASTSSSP